MKRDYVIIDNRDQYLIKDLKEYHPDDPRHTGYWRDLKKKCIEGTYGVDNGLARYMPSVLFFYGNFFTLFDTDENKQRLPIKPFIDDIEWERSYMWLEGAGFSGWHDDDVFTSHEDWFKYKKHGLPSAKEVMRWKEAEQNQFMHLVNKNGKLKKYKNPRENIKELKEEPLGPPIYHNGCKNVMEFGSRGGGKSFFWAGVAQHGLAFQGAKLYNEETRLMRVKAEIAVGSGASSKSSDFMKKVKQSNDYLATANGAYGKPGDPDYEPSPFYLDMEGSIKPNNKENPWRHEYQVKDRGRWVTKGTGSYIAHVIYSPNKKTGAEEAAGGRYLYVIYEECGLTEKLIDAWGSNEGTVYSGRSHQVGMQIALGTSGNMDVVEPSRHIFTHPRQYNLVTYQDEWENTGEVGFFLPNYMTRRDRKDHNGNTDYDAAIAEYKEEEAIKMKASNQAVLRHFRMNKPNKISDMWQREKGNILCAAEAEERIKELLIDNLYESIGTPVTLKYDSLAPNGVSHELNKKADPFFEPLFRYNKEDLEGSVMIYDFPIPDVPDDYYSILGHDPFAGEDQTEGDSLGAAYLITNPKYTHRGLPGNTIVASYVGRPYYGKDVYYENLLKLLMFYGCPPRSLWYEADRGDSCKEFFRRKGQIQYLCHRPIKTKGDNAKEQPVAKYGYKVGSIQNKLELLSTLNDWLLTEVEWGHDNKKRVIERIPDIWLLRQIAQFDLQGNFDGVMAVAGCSLAVQEQKHDIEAKLRNKNRGKNRLSILSANVVN